MFNRSSRSFDRRAGLTLVEVVAGMVLLGTLASGTIAAWGVHRRQIRTAHNTLAAVSYADELLHQWSRSEEGLPRIGSGFVRGSRAWRWSVQPVSVFELGERPIETIRLQIVEPATERRGARTMCTVEYVRAVELEATL